MGGCLNRPAKGEKRGNARVIGGTVSTVKERNITKEEELGTILGLSKIKNNKWRGVYR